LWSLMRRAGRGAGYAAVEAASAAALWGSIGVVYRLAVMHGADPAWLVAGRPAAASLFSFLLILGGILPSWWSVIVGLFGLAPLYVSYFFAVERVGAAVASLLLYTAPLWVTALSPLVGDRVEQRQALAAATGFLGAALLAAPAGKAEPVGAALGLMAGLSYAAYILLARLGQKRGASVEQVSVHAFPFAAAGVLAVVRPHGLPGARDVAYMLYLAVAGTVVPYMLNARALSRLEASRVAVISLVEPLTATILAAAVLGESMTLSQCVGAALVLAGSLAAARRRAA